MNTNTHTYMYLPYGHVTNGDFPPLLWEKTGELSDGCLNQALGKSRCSYFADTKLPLASEIRLDYIVWTHFPLIWGCIHYIVWTNKFTTCTYVYMYDINGIARNIYANALFLLLK